MTKSNLITNTGHRFISKGKTAFKIHIHTPDVADPNNRDTCYIAKWRVMNDKGEYKYKTVVRSISKYGKLAAYSQTKKALLEAHKENLEILTFMGRLNSIGLK